MKQLKIENAKTIEQVYKYLKQNGHTAEVIVDGTVIFTTEQLEDQHGENERIDYGAGLPIQVESDESTNMVEVLMDEPFDCCGKVYLHDFDTHCNGHLEKAMLKVSEIIAKRRGYTYVGFVHKTSNPVVKAATQLGYKAITKFRNKRTSNQLSEMCKILGK